MNEKLINATITEYKSGEKKILEHINFEVNPGEIVAIIGENGAGKSTLFRHLTGEIKNTNAKIFFLNKEISQYKTNALALNRSVLEQSNELDFALKVRDVVALGRIPSESIDSLKESMKYTDDALLEFDLENLSERNFLSLSGGEKQRVHLARVLCQLYPHFSNKVILLDEPDNSLDISHVYQMMNKLALLKEKKLGIVVILHDLNLVAQYADRIYLLKGGKVLQEGSVKEVMKEEYLTEAFNHSFIIHEHPLRGCPLIISK